MTPFTWKNTCASRRGEGAISQLIFPLIPSGASQINSIVSVVRDEKNWTYFIGNFPVFSHPAKDHRGFTLISAQLISSGTCRQADILKTFGVSKSMIIRAENKLRLGGMEAFFAKRRGRKGGTVLTPNILPKAQFLLEQGKAPHDVALDLEIPFDTLRKAIVDGRLRKCQPLATISEKSSRSILDAKAAAGMGTACTLVEERVLASFGICDGAPLRFESSLDVPHGGVICALPALLANGLFDGAVEILGKIKGYYTTIHMLLLLSFMALCRVKTVEKLRGYAPGEFGKLLGLDRVPEVRCLREKLDSLSADTAAERWARHLSISWMEKNPELIGTLYVDGHVRVYHGSLTKLPRHFVSRERLCLRGIADYWVNDAVGLPFFVVEKPVDPGLLKTLEEDIIPRCRATSSGRPVDARFAKST